MDEGAMVVAEMCEDGLLLRPAVTVPRAFFSPEAEAKRLLEGAADVEAYIAARARVTAMGVNPNRIPHTPPTS
jgi:hypothetical protein